MNSPLTFSQMLHMGWQVGDMLKANSPLVKQPASVPVAHSDTVHCGSFVAGDSYFDDTVFGVVACLNPLTVLWQNGNIKHHPFATELYAVPQDIADAKYIKEYVAAASPELIAEVVRFMDPDQQYGPEKIQAIKRFREATNIGLREAKMAVEAIARGEYPKPPKPAKAVLSVSKNVDVEVKRV